MPPENATVVVFDPHVGTALQVIFLALVVVLGYKFYEWVKEKLKE